MTNRRSRVAGGDWTAEPSAATRDLERHLLWAGHGMPVALFDQKLFQLTDGVFLLPALEPQWVWDQVVEARRVQVRYDQGRKALPTAAVTLTLWPGAERLRPKCQGDGKGGAQAMMAPVPVGQSQKCRVEPAFAHHLCGQRLGGEEFEQQIQEQRGDTVERVRRDSEQTGFVLLPKM